MRASRAAVNAVAGTSIVDPELERSVDPGLFAGAREDLKRGLQLSRAWRASAASPSRVARSRHAGSRAAASSSSSCRSRPMRIPRTPRNGLSSCGISSAGSGLSAPASSVRTTRSRPSRTSAISAHALRLLVLVGQVVALEEQELGAQHADPLGAELDRSDGFRERANVGEHFDPVAVTCDRRLVGRSADRGRLIELTRAADCCRHGPPLQADRAARARPRRRRAATCRPGSRGSRRSSPTTVGRPIARATITPCAVVEPRTAITATTRCGSRCAA